MTAQDVPAVARALALAFYDDPHMRWIFRDDGRRLDRLERSFTLFIRRLWLTPDAAFTTTQMAGAALWLGPGKWHVSVRTQLAMLPALISIEHADAVRLLRAFAYIERHHPRHPEHWYLPMVGVAPAWQGRGYGSALLAPMLERCDRERVPAYLEASTPRNRALYERHGFVVREEVRYASSGPPLWLMWREPRAAPAGG